MTLRRKSAVIGLVLLIFSLAGCGDQLSLASRASALMMSVVPTTKTTFRWTFYFPNPAITVSSISNLSTTNQFYTVSTTSTSLYAALAKVQAKLSRRLYLGQLEDVVVSPQISATALSTIVNSYNTMGVLPKTVYLMAEPAKSAQAIPSTTQEMAPSLYLTRYFDCCTCQPAALTQQVWQLWDDFETPGVSPVIPFGTLTKGFSQLLVYPKRGTPQVLSRDAMRGWAFLTNHVNHETILVNTSTGLEAMTNITAHATTRMHLRQGHLDVFVSIHDEGSANEWPAHTTFNVTTEAHMEQAVSRKIVDLTLAAIQRADTTHTDPFGWERTYLFQHPEVDVMNHRRRGMMWPLNVHVSVATQITSNGVSD